MGLFGLKGGKEREEPRIAPRCLSEQLGQKHTEMGKTERESRFRGRDQEFSSGYGL